MNYQDSKAREYRNGLIQPAARPWRAGRRVWQPAILVLALLLGGGLPQPQATATPGPQSIGIALAPIPGQLDQPVAIAHAGDGSGRLFIAEQPGRIRIFDGAQLLPTPFLYIRNLVNSSGSEQGLLGLAFDPNYKTNGYFYVDYTSKSGVGDTVVARYKVSANPNIADPVSATTLLTIAQPQANHNGGQLQFGPDGYLYIGTGDGGNGGDTGPGHNPTIGNAQDLSTLLGKLLRIDVRNNNTGDGLPYDIPASNPFVSRAGARHEIWAYGLRNPWRFSFDRQTGDMFIGDVGQGAVEEIDFQPKASAGGQNYGWRCREGDQPFASDSHCASETFVEPILVYDHGGGRCAVTGGYRYRGSRSPQLQGVYLYADYCSGQIWGATASGARWNTAELLDTTFSISSFGEDQGGELYITDRSGGKAYHIVASDKHLVYLPVARR
jgi:glucose/arabinose dehydrogenase